MTKSGANEFHGSAFEFHRDNKNLDSLDNIEKRGGQLEPNASLFNVFGGTVGGPVYLPRFGEGGKSVWSGKDKAFFFVTYQGARNPSSTTVRSGSYAFLPSEFPRLLAAFPGNAVIQAITTRSVFALPGTSPRSDVPNPVATVSLGGRNFQVAQPEFTISTPYTENEYSLRGDVKPSNKDNVTVRYERQRQTYVNSLQQNNGFTGDIPASSKNFGGTWTRTLGNAGTDPRLVGISQIDALFFFGADVTDPRGFYSLNALNSTGDVIPVMPDDIHFIFNGPGAASVFGAPFGDAARNSLRGPRPNQLNASLFKNIKVGERLTVQLRGEAYNVLNHPNPGYGVNGVFPTTPSFLVDNAGVAGSNFADNGDVELARRVIQVGVRIIF